MRLSELYALELKPEGYRVAFERRRDGMLASEYLPERDERPFATLATAWDHARRLADATTEAEIVNIYVVGLDWVPVSDYAARMIRRHPRRDP